MRNRQHFRGGFVKLTGLSQSGTWPSGNPRMYYRCPGHKAVPLPDVPTESEAFAEAVEMARSGKATLTPHPNLLSSMCRACVRRAKSRARARGMEFNICSDRVVQMLQAQDFKCALSGIRFTLEKPDTSSRKPFAPSIDRIDPSVGYVHGNIRIVCAIVNCAVSDFGDDIFLTMVRRTALNMKNSNSD